MQKRGLLVTTEAVKAVKAVLVVNQAEAVASLAAAGGLLRRVAWLVVGEACLVAEACLVGQACLVGEACLVVKDAYPVGEDRQPEQLDP